jgi:HEAT repeat protein
MEGIEQARTHLESQLGPLMESWEEKREAEQRAWVEALKKSTDESIEQYKGRLENASNSWLLASATTLGQHSQGVLDTLAKSAEKRIRETCAEVLAGMGDTLKERLIGISTRFNEEDEVEGKPPKKKP